MSRINAEPVIAGALDPVAGRVEPIPDHETANEKIRLTVEDKETSAKDNSSDSESKGAPLPFYGGDENPEDDPIIITGADAAKHLLPLRDDGEPALTFRSLFLATILSAFQAVMSQIYTVSESQLQNRTSIDCDSI